MGAVSQRLELVQLAGLALLYCILSIAWSLTGFVSPSPPVHYHEYSLTSLAMEILGHLLFGVVAGLATRQVRSAALCGIEAVLIDSDHVLSALNLPVMARLSHSIPFAVIITVVFLLFPQRLIHRKTLAMVTVASILTHMSYDIYAGNGQFPLMAPFSFQFYNFPYYYWPIFELGAILLSTFVWTRGQCKL
jgi:hypothetical protein